MVAPRIMLAAPASGSGKTLITCGILKALTNRRLKTASFKCGPDYIDPLFHREALGVPACNLDTFFTGREMTRYLFCQTAKQADISIIEGVMGYYDGIGGDSVMASSYELAKVTETPVVLIINAKGMSLSVLPVLQGFLQYRQDSRITAVILNQVSAATYEKLKSKMEQELSVTVLGYVPKCPELVIESRHLGLVLPKEVQDIKEKLQDLSKLLETTLDLDSLLRLAETAPEINCKKPENLHLQSSQKERSEKLVSQSEGMSTKNQDPGSQIPEPVQEEDNEKLDSVNVMLEVSEHRLQIGITKDEAFCFFYQENLQLLMELGAELVYLSPLWDQMLPKELDGLILCGGYPELYAEQLYQNTSMRDQIRERIQVGIPYLAECGGFMYLQESLEDMDGKSWEMAGVFAGKAYRTKKLHRFGYLSLTANENGQLLEPGEQIAGHEYHYFDCTENGKDYYGRKPLSSRGWECIQGGNHCMAGFPHLYYYSNPAFVEKFLQKCREYRTKVRREYEAGRLF